MTRTEILSEFEKNVAFLAMIYVVGKFTPPQQVWTIIQVRDFISEKLKTAPTLIAIRKALQTGNMDQIATILSGNGNSAQLKFNRDEIDYYYIALGVEHKSLIWRINNIGPGELLVDLKKAKSDATAYLDSYNFVTDNDYPEPGDDWATIGFVALKGALSHFDPRKSNGAIGTSGIDTSREIDWTKWGTILTAVGIFVAVLLWYAS